MENIMTREEFYKAMQETDGDIEMGHREMDALLIKVLRQLGYGKGCDLFEKCLKWYS